MSKHDFRKYRSGFISRAPFEQGMRTDALDAVRVSCCEKEEGPAVLLQVQEGINEGAPGESIGIDLTLAEAEALAAALLGAIRAHGGVR